MSDGASEPTGSGLRLAGDEMLEAISAEMLALYGDQYHPAPRRARTYLNDNVLICVLEEDLLSPEEIDAVDRGGDEHVLTGRVAFQREHQTGFIAMVERLTGRRVATFLSANQTRPGVAAEVFILDRRV